MTSNGTRLAESAADAARVAARRSRVEVRGLSSLAELRAVYALFDGIWQPDKSNPPVTVEQLRAMTHAGNYVAGAYDGDVLVGAAVGFFGIPVGVCLHSHITGVAMRARGRSVGFALKLHQRAWALEQGLREVTWTFDPLVRRNAYFNVVKLGARPQAYLVDFYGDMGDALNVGQGSDRLLMAWDLVSPAVADACAGRPAEADVRLLGEPPRALVEREDGRPAAGPAARWRDHGTVLVQVPYDIEGLRRINPAAARDWRHAVRNMLGELLASGAQVTGFTHDGSYVVEATP